MPFTIDDTYEINPRCYFCDKVNKLKNIYFVVNIAKQTTQQSKKRVMCKSCGLNIYGYNIPITNESTN